MAIAVQKYIKNMAKSVTYSTTEILSKKFEYINDFKNENQEVFKEVYSSIKDYRTTFARVKKAITNNKVIDAARVGYDSVLYSIRTGDFYAAKKEAEVVDKYGGAFMEGVDIDDEDFNWDNEDISTGEKVIATAVKKNSKIGTALTIEAIAETGKAQMDVAKENTMLLYTQNERLLNKLDGGFQNIMGFLKQNGEQTAKVQNQMNENLNKFMTNVDNNIMKLTKQMDELLEMQRKMYNPTKEEQKKHIGYDDIISRNGVLNIKEYIKQVKKQAFNTINDKSGNMLSLVLGDTMGEGSNLLANFAAAPFRVIMESMADKVLGGSFDKAASQLNTTLEGLIPSIMAKLNASAKKDDSGIMGILGKIFGIKEGSSESVNTGNYNKGAIPFDGITKRAITDVIPYYLRKMTSVLTGGEEVTYDYRSGTWTTMRSVKASFDRVINSAKNNTADMITKIIESNMGDRSLSNAYENIGDYKKITEAIKTLAVKLQNVNGDVGSIRSSDLNTYEEEAFKAFKRALSLYDSDGKDRRFTTSINGKKIESGKGRSSISGIAKAIHEYKISQNNAIKSINENDDILRLIQAEGLNSKSLENYHGREYVNGYGDFNERYIQEMPMSQALVRAKDKYGFTLFQYIRDMGISLRYIKANSTYLGSLGNNEDNKNGNQDNDKTKDIVTSVLEGKGNNTIDYGKSEDKKYIENYYQKMKEDNENKRNRSWDERIKNAKEKAAKKGKSYIVATTADFSGKDDKIGISRFMSDADVDAETKAKLDYEKEQEKAKDERWKKISEWLGKEDANKLREISDKFDSTKGFKENMKHAEDKGFMANLMMFSKVLSNKINNPVDAASDAILKVDFWLQKLIYGEDLKESEKKQSLFERMKGEFKKGFKWIQKKLDDGFEWIKKKAEPIFEPLKKVSEFLFGTKNEDNIHEGGVLGNFIGGIQKGLRQNAKEVADYVKKQKEEAARKLKEITKSEDNDDDDETTSSSDSSSSSSSQSKLYSKITQEQARKLKQTLRNRIYHHNNDDEQEEQYYGSKERYTESIKNKKWNKLNKRVRDIKSDIDKLKNEKRLLIKELKTEIIPIYESYTHWKKEPPPELSRRKTEIEERITDINISISQKEEYLKEKLYKGFDNYKETKTMAIGGVNRTGSPFKSVLSAGEIHNGMIVPRTGIYDINPGDVVVNPAPPSVRSKQAQNERRYLADIRRNAEANDKLSPPTEAEQKEEINKIEQLMTNRDWRSLEDNKQRAEFLGSVASRGLIGGGLGLLVGGPLLGAAVGAASSLTKSTDAFSSFIFGSAIRDKNGDIQVDDKGKVVRENDGLISKEIMKSMPDVKKFGIGGAIAGLLTPLGPLGGILVGSALGFAKHAEIFQGSLFGDTGIFSDKNMKKLKKGALNMGIGSVIGAFAGPFGLLPNALIGATAGYVTSTDKFKDALLGEKIDPNDPNSKREGGVLGVIKAEIKPLKNFGRRLIDNIMDEIFGKDNGNGREGGIFGAIKHNMVEPMIQGGKSIFDSLKNNVSDLAHLIGDIYKKYRESSVGNGLLGGVISVADKVSSGLIKGAGAIGRTMTKPFRLLGEDGIGGKLTGGRIKKGTETSMTARERLMFRSRHKLGIDDMFNTSDEAMSKMSKEDLIMTQTLLESGGNLENLDKQKIKDFATFGQGTRGLLSHSDNKKLIKMMKDRDYAQAERFARTRKISDESKAELAKLISMQKNKLNIYDNAVDKINNSGKTYEELLSELGLNVNYNDPKAMRYLKKQISREIAHKDAGLTDEEIEFDKLRNFWSNDKSPLRTVNNGVENISSTITNIYNELKLANQYESLTSEEKSKYTSVQDYINKNSASESSKLNGSESEGEKKEESKPSSKNNKEKNLYEKMREVKNKDSVKLLSKIADRGIEIFNNIIKHELKDLDKLQNDIDLYESSYDYEVTYNPGDRLSRQITIYRFNKTYTFFVGYTCNSNGDVVMHNEQNSDYINARDEFVSDYMQKYMPKDNAIDRFFDKIPTLNFSDIIKKSAKAAGIISIASVIPGGLITLGALKLSSHFAKKFGLKEKVKKTVKATKRRIKYNLGSHDIDMNSKSQMRKEEKYGIKARKALNEAIENEDPQLNDLAIDMFAMNYKDLTAQQKADVNSEFINRFKDEKRSRQLGGHGLIGNITKTAGTLKSGAKNIIAGGINKAKAFKEKEQQEDKFLGKLFDHLDKWRLKREKRDLEGKKDSKLAKILKWLFVGGVATPIMVGFIKEKVMPAIHEKIQPWLKKAGEKLVGVKNPQTGEYEGGIVSGIVNPIRKFLGDKFKNIHDWFANDGKYKSSNVGLQGLLSNIKGIGEYIIELWKAGSATIYGEWLPKIFEKIGENFIPGALKATKSLLEGFGKFISKLFKGQEGAKIETDFSATGTSDTIKTQGKTIELNNGFGKKIYLQVPSVSAKVNPNFNIGSKTNSDGTKTFINGNESITSQKINDYDMYYVNTTPTGKPVYVNKKNNIKYIKDEETKTYIPLSEFQKKMNNDLNDNTELQNFIDTENASELHPGFADPNASTRRIATTTSRLVGITNNFRILGSGNNSKIMNAMRGISEISSSAIKKIPFLGNKLNFIKRGLEKTIVGGSKLTTKLQSKVYTKSGKLVEGILGFTKKIKGKITKTLMKLFKSEKVSKLLGKVFKENSEKIAKQIEFKITKLIEKNADEIAKLSGKYSAKTMAKFVPFISVVANFILGMDDCRNILGIVSENPALSERIVAGLLNAFPDILISVAGLLTASVAASIVGGALAIAGILGVILLSIPEMRSQLIDGILDVLDTFGIDTSGIRKKRQDAVEAVGAFNEVNKTSITLEEYNNLMNPSNARKISSAGANIWSATFGYDSATKGDVNAISSAVKGANKYAEKVRKKLNTVVSSIWQHFGKDDFNYSEAVDGEGNELTGKKKLNVNNLKFTSLMGNIISELITLLNNEDEQVAMDVYSNVTDLTGFYDSRSRLKKLYKEGKNNPKSQFDISDEHATFKRIRAIAGICSIFNYVFKPLGKQYDVTSIIVSKLIPAYFTSSESDTEVIDWANETYYQVDVSKYEANNSNEVYGPQLPNIAMNANTNNGLSPISTKSNGIGEIFVNMINKSIGKLTGNFDKVEELFASLTNKNKSINDSIDKLTVLPNNKKYWKIELDKQNPFLSGLYNFIETMNRVVKAPIALASASLGGTLSTLSSSTSTTTPSNNNNSNTINNDNKTNNNSGVLTKLTTGAKSIGKTMLKTAMSWFGFGRGNDDPYHIYQRDYNGSYRTSGDTENQTIADSGCGPAAAASLLRMYGKNGDIHNAANYAMNNKYKEVNGGTYPQFFNDYLNKNGISTNSNANNTDVINNLVHNKPVILMGRDMNNSGRTPYGSKYSHYVVARGLDSNGNVIVEDSEDKNGSTRYSLADTLKNSSVKITTGTGKYGRAKESTTSSTGLLGLIGKYSNTITKGIFGDFYDALYGNETNNSSSNNTNTTSSFSGSLAEGDAESNMKAMFSYMKSQGFSDNLAAGILGNIKEESGFDPHIIEGGGSGTITEKMSGGYGLAQWTSPSSRACLYNWCTANNCNPESLEGQTKWIVAQIKGINISDEANPNNASMFNGATGQGTMSYNWSLFKARGTFDTFNTYSIEKAVRLWLECAERPADISGAAIRRTKYAKEILAACTSGSGRGRKFINNISNNPKYGRSVWGRDGEEETNNTSTSLTNKISEYSSKITEGVNNASEKINTIKSSNNSDSKSLISKLTDYATRITKGVYGDFYEALYGSTTTESNDTIPTAGNSNDVVYAAAMVFEAMGKANPTFGYCYCGNRIFTITCRDGTVIEQVRPDCSGMMSAVIQYMGYYTSYKDGTDNFTDTYRGPGYNVTAFLNNTGIYDKNRKKSEDWQLLDFDPNDKRPGDMFITNSGGHIDMYVFTDDNGNSRGFNAGSGGTFPDGHCDSPGHGIENSYNFACYYLDNNCQLPPKDGSIGAWTIQDNEAGKILRYVGNGSGRGKGSKTNNKYTNINKSNRDNTPSVPMSVQNKIAQLGKQGNPYITSYNGRGVLKSFDDVRQNNRSYTNTGRSSRNVNGYNSNNGITVNSNGSISNTSIDLNQLIGLINVIANNADKMDAVLQLLGTIATNTENTTTAVTNKNNNTSSKNGLSALRSALDSNGSGMDIVNAVYQIAKS